MNTAVAKQSSKKGKRERGGNKLTTYTPGPKLTRAEKTKQWRKANPQLHLEQKRRYDAKRRAERRDDYNAKRRRKRANNPETNHETYSDRKMWYALGDVTAAQLESLVAIAQGRCKYCGEKVKTIRCNPLDPRGFDHRVSKAKGGSHTFANIVLCCRSCNERKGAE